MTGGLSWERGTFLFNIEKKNPSNNFHTGFVGALKQENFQEKSKVFTDIFSCWGYYFLIFFVKLEPASYQSTA